MAVSAPQVEIGYAHSGGYTGAGSWWQLDPDESTPELQWPQSVAVYNAMRTQDAQVGSVLEAVTRPVLRTPWRIDPAGARPEVVEFVADDLGLPIVGQDPTPPPRARDRFSWVEHLELALLMLPFGHMFFEQVYRVDKDARRAHLRKLGPRMPRTIAEVNVARDGGLVSITQYGAMDQGPSKPIPVSRLVAYVYKREGGNWLGRSILRQAYKNWLIKDRLLRVQAQTIERNGMGIPLYEAQENAKPEDLAAGLAMARAWRSGEAAGSAIPFGAKLSLVGVQGDLPDADPAIRYHDEQIARAVLAHFLNLGTQTGSWALGTTFAEFFTLSLQTLAQQVADTATRHIVEDLVDVNWGEDEPAPKITFDEIGSRQAATAQAIKALVDAGVIAPDEVLEQSTRQQYGLPPKDPNAAVEQAAGADALLAAIDAYRGPSEPEPVAAAGRWDPALHPRDTKGRFRTVFERVMNALAKWAAGGGDGDPFEGFDREQLRKVAVTQKVTLRRGASREQIGAAILDDLRQAIRADRKRKADLPRLVPEGKPKAVDPTRFHDPAGPDRPQVIDRDGIHRDVAIVGRPNGAVILSTVDSSTGERMEDLARVESMAALREWAREHDYPDLAAWVDKHGDAKSAAKPVAKVAKKAAPKRVFDRDEVAETITLGRVVDGRRRKLDRDEVDQELAGLNLAQLRRVATGVKLDVPDNDPDGRRWTRGTLAAHIADKVMRDRFRQDREEEGQHTPAPKKAAPKLSAPTVDKSVPSVDGPSDDADLAAMVDTVAARLDGFEEAKGPHGDEMAYQLARLRGFDRPPKVVTAEEYDQLVADGHEPLYRGVGDDLAGVTGEEYAEFLRSGEAYIPTGAWGSGIYTSRQLHIARTYGPNPLRMTLSRDARVVDWRELRDEHTAFLATLEPGSDAHRLFSDRGRYATARGYDAMRVPGSMNDEVLVFNRSALIVRAGGQGVAPGAAKKAAPRRPAFDPAEVAGRVGDQQSESEIIRLLAGDPQLTSAKLRKVADELGIDVPDDIKSKGALQLHIAEKVARGRDLPGGFGDAPRKAPTTSPAGEMLAADVARLRALGDVEAIRDDLDLKKLPELKELAGHLGVAKSGRKKRDLVDRLVDSIGPARGDDDGLDDLSSLALGDLAREHGISDVPLPMRDTDRPAVLAKLRQAGVRAPETEPESGPQRPTGPRELGAEDLALLQNATRPTGLHRRPELTGAGRQFNARIDQLRREGYIKKERGSDYYSLTGAGRAALAREPDRLVDGIGPGGTAKPGVPDDGLDALEDHQLKSLAGEFEIPNARTLSRQTLLRRLRAEGAKSPYLRETAPLTPRAGVVVAGRMSDKPILPNRWGSGQGEVHFHPDGAIGDALQLMDTSDRRLDVDGEPLANVLGRLATDGVRGRKTTQQVLDELKVLRDRMPEGSAARRALDGAVRTIDAPARDPLPLPDGTPAPIRELMETFSRIPLARRTDYAMLGEGDQQSEMDLLADIVRRWQAGEHNPRSLIQGLGPERPGIRHLRNRHHESVEGKFELDRAVDKAVADLDAIFRDPARRAELKPPAAPTPPRSRAPGTVTVASATTTLDRLSADLAQIPGADRRTGGLPTPNELVAQWRRQIADGELSPDALPELFERMTVRYSVADGDPVGEAFARAAGNVRGGRASVRPGGEL